MSVLRAKLDPATDAAFTSEVAPSELRLSEDSTRDWADYLAQIDQLGAREGLIEVPTLDFYEVKGTLNPDSGWMLIKVLVDPDTCSLELNLNSDNSDGSALGYTRLVVIDEANPSQIRTYDWEEDATELRVELSFAPETKTTVWLQLLPPPQSCGPSDPGSSADGALSFTMNFRRNRPATSPGEPPVEPGDPNTTGPTTPGGDETGTTNPGSGDGEPTLGNPQGPSPWMPGEEGGGGYGGGQPTQPTDPSSPATGPAPSTGSGTGNWTGQPPLTIAVPIAVGPLPTRSAAPLGGVLSSSEQAPVVSRHEAARADLDRTVVPEELTTDSELDLQHVVPDGDADGEVQPVQVKVSVTRGPGGLPVVANVLPNVETDDETSPSVDPATLVQQATQTAMVQSAVLMVGPTNRATSPEVHSTAPNAGRDDGARRRNGRSRTVRECPALPGLSLALLGGVSLVLPDVNATWHASSLARRRITRLLRRRIRVR